MPETIIAKIQNRTGLRQNLPQPLDLGELAVCLDTGQVYVGLDPSDPNSLVSPIIGTFSPSNQSTNDANSVIDNQLVQINLTSSTDTTTIANDFGVDEQFVRINEDETRAYVLYDWNAAASASVSGGAITSVSIDNAGYGYSGNFTDVVVPGGDNNARVSFTVVGGSVTSHTITVPGTGYIDGNEYYPDFSNSTSPPTHGPISLPSPAYGTAGFFSTISTLNFVEGRMDFSDLGYLPSDLDAIASLINVGYRRYDSAQGSHKPGLVKLIQNVEILTEHSQFPFTSDLLFTDYNLPIRSLLDTNTGLGGFINVQNGSFSLTDSNSFIIDYSLSDGGSYNRVGTMMISVNDSDATMNDTYTEINPDTYSIDFNAERTVGNEMVIQYTKPFAETIQMSMTVRRWQSSW